MSADGLPQAATGGGVDPEAGGPDAHLIERCIGTRQVYRGRFLDVRVDTVALPQHDGTATREYIVHPGAVMVVPILDDGRLVMERQYRYPLGRVMLEFPAGKLEPGEAAQCCGQRELLEETGYRAREWAHACTIHNAMAYSNERIEILFARGLTQGAQRLDHGESLDVVVHTETELDALAARGKLTDVKTLIGLQWLQKWRAGSWALDWGPEA